MTSRTRTPQDLGRALDEQIRFLESSSDAFDNGFEGEAKRLAVTLRILLHDSRSSYSLLGQLEKKGVPFFDTSRPIQINNRLTSGTLVQLSLTGTSLSRHFAPLDDAIERTTKNFEDWWNTEIFRNPDGASLTRKALILSAADQDGGAHVDPTLDEMYARFSRDDTVGMMDVCGGIVTPMPGQAGVAIRQIAHEVLKTLKDGYTKKPVHTEPGIVIGNLSCVVLPPLEPEARQDDDAKRPGSFAKAGTACRTSAKADARARAKASAKARAKTRARGR